MCIRDRKLDDRSMAREELELEIPDAEVGKTLLQRIGFYSVPVLEKKRRYFRRNEMTACVDHVTGLGDYLELEIMVETEAEREGALQRIENVLVDVYKRQVQMELKNLFFLCFLSGVI